MYTVRQITELGLIPCPTGSKNKSSNYQYILRKIKSGELEHTILNPEADKPHYVVSKRQLKDFVKKGWTNANANV